MEVRTATQQYLMIILVDALFLNRIGFSCELTVA